MAKIATSQLMFLDCREKENMSMIQKCLTKIKPLARYEGSEELIPQEMVEKVIFIMETKYHVCIQWLTLHRPSLSDTEGICRWSCSIKRDDNHEWLGSFEAHTMYELMCKTAIKLYSDVKKHDIPTREVSEEKTIRKKLGGEVGEDNGKDD